MFHTVAQPFIVTLVVTLCISASLLVARAQTARTGSAATAITSIGLRECIAISATASASRVQQNGCSTRTAPHNVHCRRHSHASSIVASVCPSARESQLAIPVQSSSTQSSLVWSFLPNCDQRVSGIVV